MANFTINRGRTTPNRITNRQGWTPDHFVLHTTGGTFTSAVNTIMNAANEVSYWAIIERTGGIHVFGNLRDWFFANGTRNDGGSICNSRSTLRLVRERRVNANLYTVPIAFADMLSGNPSRRQLEACAWLMRHANTELQRISGSQIPLRRDRVVGHGEIAPVTRANCPGRAFPFNELIRMALNGSNAPAVSVPQPAPTPSAISVGDVVTINARAVYGGLSSDRGRAVPASQLGSRRHTVNAISINRGVAEARLQEINSWVALASLTRIDSNAPAVIPAPVTNFDTEVVRVANEIWTRANFGGWGTGATRRNALVAHGNRLWAGRGTAFADAVQTNLNRR